MGRRKHNAIEAIATLPWPAGVLLGILAYAGLRYGLGAYLSTSASPVTQQMGQALSNGAWTPLAWLTLAICWLGALLSYIASRKRKRLLAAQTGLDSLRALTWREFELLVGGAFRRQGYAVEETSQGGADGGIDLILRKHGRTELVQCKQWRNLQISVSVVREMWGLAHHHRADAVKIVGVGGFTRDAEAFAQGKPIELVSGERLLAMVREVQSSMGDPKLVRVEPTLEATQASTEPSCPSCGSTMIRRANRITGQPFWGCRAYPACKGTRAAEAQ